MEPLPQLNTALEGRYAVEREIGAGGMATVYLAHDLRHDRHVALKVLKPELGAVLGVERFLAEIKVTANLQHPNLLPLFDSGEANGLLFYVMPFVDGETLRARLEREKQLPVDEAIAITRAIASALDYAHSANVIHRDLKPENILFQAGQPVLADFGIALAVANAGGARITQTGLSLGTPQYMSPEQATGDRVIDGRTDLYSLAAVCYEMLTGEPPHTGNTAQAIIARVLTDKPRSVRATRDTVPPHVEAALERALAKLPADRFTTTREFAQALGSGAYSTAALGSTSGATSGQNVQFSFSIPRATLIRIGKLGAVAAAIALGAWGWLRTPAEVPTPRMRFTIELPDSLAPASSVGQQSLALSPDGSEIVYPTILRGGALYRRRLDDFSVVAVPDGDASQNPRYSPDGRWLAMERNGRLIKVPLAGGPSVPIADDVLRQSWGDDDMIVFARGSGLWRVPSAGGTPVRLTSVDSSAGESAHSWPHVLPGGKAVLFEIALAGKQIGDNELAVVRGRDGRVARLGIKGSNPRYVRTGHILFTRQDGTVSALPFDASSLEVRGAAVTVLERVVVKTGGAGMFAVSESGVLAFIEGESLMDVVMVDRRGSPRRLTATPGDFRHPRISPTGDRVTYTRVDQAKSDIWALTLGTGQLSRLTRDGNSDHAEWSADGQRIAWLHTDSAGTTLRWQKADGSGQPEPISTTERGMIEFTMSPRGGFATVVAGPTGSRDIALVPLDGAVKARPLVNTRGSDMAPSISPDGRWLAFHSNESGRYDVYISSIENSSTRLQVSTDGGTEPAWAPDGRMLFYRATGVMLAAALSFVPRFDVVRRDTLFVDRFRNGGFTSREYDVNRRTGEFVMAARGAGARERVVVVTGWLDELKERMASAGRR